MCSDDGIERTLRLRRQRLGPSPGTGGVSLFGVQFAVAAGARVIATTNSKEKAEKLKELDATHVINYKEDSNWEKRRKRSAWPCWREAHPRSG
jgi:NADPH:quinone reductase-like Zn-dependent oxidoreductase